MLNKLYTHYLKITPHPKWIGDTYGQDRMLAQTFGWNTSPELQTLRVIVMVTLMYWVIFGHCYNNPDLIPYPHDLQNW
jgi:hypothetical protein